MHIYRDEKFDFADSYSTIGGMHRLKHFQKFQRHYEYALIASVLVINAVVLATSRIMDRQRHGSEFSYAIWEPFVWEISSMLATLALLPAIIWLLNKCYLSWQKIGRSILIFFIASLVFSALHIAGMVLIRELVYLSQGVDYNFGNLWYEFIYEYRKDLLTFLFLIGLLQAYRFIMQRLQGDASIVINEDLGQNSTKESVSYDRILVKKLGREFIIKIRDIEWLESSGNYVNLHIKDRIYPTRNTLTDLIQEISAKGFCRTHRSFAVNLDYVDSIETHSSGSSEVSLSNGKTIPLSRRYYDELKSSLI